MIRTVGPSQGIRAVSAGLSEPGVPEQVIPVRMRREARHNGPAQLAKVVREAADLGAGHPWVDEQHTGPALHHNGVALHEAALVDQHALRDLPQHEPASFASRDDRCFGRSRDTRIE